MSYSGSDFLRYADHRLASETNRLATLMGRRNDIAEAELRADADEEREERRDRAKRWAESCAKHQARYDEVYGRFGERAPARIADESPFKYRRRLFRGLQDRLPSDSKWRGVDCDQLDKEAIGPIEEEVLQAAQKEGEQPSPENMPSDGSLIARHRVDAASGQKFIDWYGKRSFIADLARRGQRVVAFLKDGEAIYPPRLRETGFVKEGLISRR
jgi:hypothetical protein